MLTKNNTPLLSRRTAWVALLVIVLAGLAVVAVPVWIIQPFAPQSQSGLELSYSLRQWSPVATIVAAAAALGLVVWLWLGARRWSSKAVLIVIAAPLFIAAWFSRQNHFEWMFNPLTSAAYARVSEAGFVADTDMVLAVENSGDAAAYPVRLLAYHHIAQDVVGGTPVVVTY
jgi:hypothetical protein